MRATLATFLAVAGIASINAELYRCDALSYPDYDTCDLINAQVPWNEVSGPTEVPNGQCLSWTWTPGGNCQIQACNYRTDGASSYMSAFTGDTSYSIIKQWCAPQNSGGQSPGDGQLITYAVLYNPNGRAKPISRVKRSSIQGNLTVETMSVSEAEAIREEARQASQASSVQKREDSWEPIAQSLGITRGDRDRMSPVIGSGVTQQYSTTKGYSQSVSSTVEISAGFFEIFSASVSISFSYEESVSYAETIAFDPTGKCEEDQEGVAYMYPLWDQYLGYKNGDTSSIAEINVPVKGDNNYKVILECLG